MVRAKLLRCEGCGAPLAPPKGRPTIACSYCGRELLVVADATQVTAQLEARALTDRLLAGYTGEDVGEGRRFGVAEMRARDWRCIEYGVWPSAARASTQWGGRWSASALVGPPRVYPAHGDIGGAWAPRTRDSEVEWIEVQFPRGVPPARAIRVFETNLPGTSFAVTLIEGGHEELIWQRAPYIAGSEAQVLEIDLVPARPVERLRVYVNNSLGSHWSEIDTVGLVAVEPLPVGRQARHPRRRSALRWGCITALLLALLAGGGCALAGFLRDDPEPTAIPPQATQSVARTTLMVWNVPSDRLVRSMVWANEVSAFSSQYSDQMSAAHRALGPPDVFPSYGDRAAAWAPSRRDRGGEFIDVRFGQAVRASAVVIVETYGAGALVRVEDVTPGREAAVLWEGVTLPTRAARVLRLELAEPRAISAVRVVLDTGRVEGWNEIDAIGLHPAP